MRGLARRWAAPQPLTWAGAVAAIVVFGPADRLTNDTIKQVAPLVVQSAAQIGHAIRR